MAIYRGEGLRGPPWHDGRGPPLHDGRGPPWQEVPCVGHVVRAPARTGPSSCAPASPPEHRTGTPVAPPSACPHVGGLATSPEGEHYCGGG